MDTCETISVEKKYPPMTDPLIPFFFLDYSYNVSAWKLNSWEMYIQYDLGRRAESMTSMNICPEQSTTTIGFFC